MAWFYEIRSSDDALLKRDGGFATPDAAKEAVRGDAKQLRYDWQPGQAQVGKLVIGQNMEKATR